MSPRRASFITQFSDSWDPDVKNAMDFPDRLANPVHSFAGVAHRFSIADAGHGRPDRLFHFPENFRRDGARFSWCHTGIFAGR